MASPAPSRPSVLRISLAIAGSVPRTGGMVKKGTLPALWPPGLPAPMLLRGVRPLPAPPPSAAPRAVRRPRGHRDLPGPEHALRLGGAPPEAGAEAPAGGAGVRGGLDQGPGGADQRGGGLADAAHGLPPAAHRPGGGEPVQLGG